MLVLGIDPGTRQLGYGFVEQRADDIQTHDYGTLRLQSSLSMEQRLYQIHSHIVNMISMFTPDEIAIEEPFLGHGSSQYITPAFAIGPRKMKAKLVLVWNSHLEN